MQSLSLLPSRNAAAFAFAVSFLRATVPTSSFVLPLHRSAHVSSGSPSATTHRRFAKYPYRSRSRLNMSGTADRQTYPELCVFDLDACFWDKEMFEMTAVPTSSDVVLGDLNGRGEGVVGVMSGRDRISLHRGSIVALQGHADGDFPGMRVALASSADTPFAEDVGRAALRLLEVLPGMTVWDVLMRDWENVDVNQIGRQPPLSPNKARTHFPRLREATGVRYDRMLFFDDCVWGDHCGMVAAACREDDTGLGVATVRTPNGLGVDEWREGLRVYAEHATRLTERQQR